MEISPLPSKIATFKWFTDNYTRGSWEAGVSDNIFDTSRSNVSANSNKAINYNDLLNPHNYSRNIDATTDQCVCEDDIKRLMRDTYFIIDITFDNRINETILYFTNTDFDTGPEIISSGYPIKLDVTINDFRTEKVSVDYQGAGTNFSMRFNESIYSIKINKVSVYRPNKTTSYIIKPQITFNYATGLSVSIGEQALKFATVGSEIDNYIPDSK